MWRVLPLPQTNHPAEQHYHSLVCSAAVLGLLRIPAGPTALPRPPQHLSSQQVPQILEMTTFGQGGSTFLGALRCTEGCQRKSCGLNFSDIRLSGTSGYGSSVLSLKSVALQEEQMEYWLLITWYWHPRGEHAHFATPWPKSLCVAWSWVLTTRLWHFITSRKDIPISSLPVTSGQRNRAKGGVD